MKKLSISLAILVLCGSVFAQGIGGKAAIGGKAGIGGGAVAGCTGTVTAGEPVTPNVNHSAGTNLNDTGAGPVTSDANTMYVEYLSFDGAGASISGCTYQGLPMISVGSPAHNGTSNGNTQFFYIMAPATGTITVLCTGTNVTEYYYGAESFHNVNTVTPIRPGSYQTGTSNSLTIPSNSQDLTFSGIEASNSTSSSNQTSGVTNAGNQSAGEDYATTPGASVTHTWTASGNFAMAGASAMCKQ